MTLVPLLYHFTNERIITQWNEISFPTAQSGRDQTSLTLARALPSATPFCNNGQKL